VDTTQVTNLAVALATLIAAVTALIKVWKTDTKVNNVQSDVANVQTDVTTVKSLANGNHQVLLARVDQLQNTITAGGGQVPATPVVPDVPDMPVTLPALKRSPNVS
jgi:uncharacterized protein YoxC